MTSRTDVVIVGGLALLAVCVGWSHSSVIPDHREHGSHEPVGEVPCPGCARERSISQQQLTDQQLREMRIEMIKQQILQKLQLSHPPNITFPTPKHLPAPLQRFEEHVVETDDTHQHHPHDSDSDDFYGKTTEIVVFSEKLEACDDSKPSGCFMFPLKDGMRPSDVRSAELWIYKLPEYSYGNHTLQVSRLGIPSHGSSKVKEVLANRKVNGRSGWVRIDIRSQVKRWLHHPHSNHGLQVSCRSCSNSVPFATHDDKPFLMLHTREARPKRQRRSVVDCSESSVSCCRESLTVRFKDIGWDKWIIQPESYQANYCKGSCSGLVLPKYHHTQLMQAVAGQEENPESRASLTPCCAPTRLSSISLLYYNESGSIRNTMLPNMVVESCGCS